MNRPYIIAEVGVNFYDTAKVLKIAPIQAAKMYIDAAKEAGIDAVKFQSYKADTIVSKNSPAYWDTSKEPTSTQYELFKKFDHFCEKDYRTLAMYCLEKDIEFISTPFDFESADYLDSLVSVFKISSSDITNIPFIRHIAKKAKPVYLSTGASYLSEIDEAVRALEEEGCPEIVLLHCVLSYPTKNEDANLARIKALKAAFPKIRVGYSDHTLPDKNALILTAATLFGAEVIEKHFTLDKTLLGNDHYHAGDPEDFKNFIANLELLNTVYGSESITVFPCEETSRREARRSIVAARDIKQGERISADSIAFKRPGWGISPKHFHVVDGRMAQCDIKADDIITWEML